MPAPDHSVFTGRMLYLMLNKQCKSTEGTIMQTVYKIHPGQPG